MELQEARAILGVKPADTTEAVKAAHRLRVQMLHPDRHMNAPQAVQDEATRATQQLNEALRVCLSGCSGAPFSQQTERTEAAEAQRQAASPIREPNAEECSFCGSRPALPLTLRSIRGWLIWYRSRNLVGSFCRSCGLALVNDMQAATATWGWWGPIAAACNLWVLAANAAARKKLSQLEPPSHRMTDLLTPLQRPMHRGSKPSRRLAPWAGSAAAVAIASVLTAGALRSQAEYVPTANDDADVRTDSSAPAVPAPEPTSVAALPKSSPPASLSSAGIDAGDGRRVMAVVTGASKVVVDSEWVNVQAALRAYFQAINDSDYQRAWERLDEDTQSQVGNYESFVQGVDTSRIAYVDVESTDRNAAGQATARVNFRSNQAPEDGPSNAKCTDWTIRYTFGNFTDDITRILSAKVLAQPPCG